MAAAAAAGQQKVFFLLLALVFHAFAAWTIRLAVAVAALICLARRLFIDSFTRAASFLSRSVPSLIQSFGLMVGPPFRPAPTWDTIAGCLTFYMLFNSTTGVIFGGPFFYVVVAFWFQPKIIQPCPAVPMCMLTSRQTGQQRPNQAKPANQSLLVNHVKSSQTKRRQPLVDDERKMTTMARAASDKRPG